MTADPSSGQDAQYTRKDSAPVTTLIAGQDRRGYGVAVGYGFVAGALTAVTFCLMKGVQHLIWDHGWLKLDAVYVHCYTALVVLLGGALIAWLRPLTLEGDLEDQLDPEQVRSRHWRRIAVVALSAILAVGCGGAIGPEAGLLAVVPALLGAALSLGYLLARHYLSAAIARVGSVRRQTLVGSAALAVVLAGWPLLRFSGHDDFALLTAQVEAGAWALLLAIGVAKVSVTALCLASGWRGGDFFPLMFAGAATGGAALALLPALDTQTAMVAGMAAATTVGVRKPVAVFILLWFLVPEVDIVALAVAGVIGALTLKFMPDHPALAARSQGAH